uniref:Uncharacterized protein n=1 Tax=Lepeophtheirus salmonis TaxID=72036 RepID=A0A0K2UJC2_LEPSM
MVLIYYLLMTFWLEMFKLNMILLATIVIRIPLIYDCLHILRYINTKVDRNPKISEAIP